MAYDVYQYSAADQPQAARSNVVRPDCWDETRQALLHHGDRQHPNRYQAENGTTYIINGNATIINGQYLPANGQDYRRPGNFDPRAADLNYQELQRLQAQNYYRPGDQPGYPPGYQTGYQPGCQPAGYNWQQQQQIARMQYQEQLREQAMLNGQNYGYPPVQPSAGFHIGFGGRHGRFGINIGNPGYQQAYYQPSYQQPYYQPGYQQPYYQPSYQQAYYQPSYQQPYYQPGYQQPYYQPSYQQAYYQPSYQQPYYQPSYQQAYYQPAPFFGLRIGGRHGGFSLGIG